MLIPRPGATISRRTTELRLNPTTITAGGVFYGTHRVSECRARPRMDGGKLAVVKIAQLNVGCENNLKMLLNLLSFRVCLSTHSYDG